ncbi:uncharacterized protein LOC143078200 isoform X2 [Mytilus galloprovincialis]|uniref:uncharacterized protein LOC143078200 isoform X2 n=1 Tax=Mytilus galloprovincialis TaxID=29158 RepID=UPI003F7B4609
MFELNLQTVVKGRECSHVDICGTQLSFHLLVPLYKKKGNLYTVASGLKKMLKKSEPFRSGELPCRNCDKTKALKRETIKYLVVSKVPEILILQIGRTENTETYNSLRKRNILVRYQHTLKIDEVEWADTLDQLFERLSETLNIETEYITFTYNGKQFRYDSSEKSKRLTDIGLIDRSTIFVVSRVKGGYRM